MTTSPHALILAGGQGRRLGGVRKADLRVGGSRLLERVHSALAGSTETLLVSTGPAPDTLRLPGHAIAVPDLSTDHTGPLAGLAAAIDWLTTHSITGGLLVTAAIDTPFLPADFVDVMVDGLGSSQAAYATCGAAFYPTNAIWRIEHLRDLPQRVRNDDAPQSLKRLLSTLRAVAVQWPETADGHDPFANLNTLSDLVALTRRAVQRRHDDN